MLVRIAIVTAALGPLAAVGPLTCIESQGSPDEITRTAEQIWIAECANCHGLTAQGDGEMAPSLRPPPPALADPCRKITDEQVAKVILSGGREFDGAQPMRPYHELGDAPKVLGELVALVQSFRPPDGCDEPPPETTKTP